MFGLSRYPIFVSICNDFGLNICMYMWVFSFLSVASYFVFISFGFNRTCQRGLENRQTKCTVTSQFTACYMVTDPVTALLNFGCIEFGAEGGHNKCKEGKLQ